MPISNLIARSFSFAFVFLYELLLVVHRYRATLAPALQHLLMQYLLTKVYVSLLFQHAFIVDVFFCIYLFDRDMFYHRCVCENLVCQAY